MAVRDGRGDVRQTTTGFRGPLMVQSLTSAKSKFLSLIFVPRYESMSNKVGKLSLRKVLSKINPDSNIPNASDLSKKLLIKGI